MDLHGDALNKIVGDMDDMESKKMYPEASGGATITISITPGTGDHESGAEEPNEQDSGLGDHDEAMCGGGCAMHKGGLAMAGGGMVPASSAPISPIPNEEDEMKLPPFLRKKRDIR